MPGSVWCSGLLCGGHGTGWLAVPGKAMEGKAVPQLLMETGCIGAAALTCTTSTCPHASGIELPVAGSCHRGVPTLVGAARLMPADSGVQVSHPTTSLPSKCSVCLMVCTATVNTGPGWCPTTGTHCTVLGCKAPSTHTHSSTMPLALLLSDMSSWGMAA